MTSNAKRIGEFQLIDHGIEHSQYFQGCGVSFTPFSEVVTGIGNCPAEAIEDCLDQIAQNGYDADDAKARIMEQEGWWAMPQDPIAPKADEMWYHVSIRWNGDE